MDTSVIIFSVIGILVISMVISAIVQQREQIAAAKKQKATQYLYRGKSAQELLEKIRGEQVNPEIIQFILTQITNNFSAAAKTFPALNSIQQLLSRAEMHQQGYKPSAQESLAPAADESQQKIHLSKINQLYSYLKNQAQQGTLTNQQFKLWGEQLKNESYHYEIDGLVKLAMRSIEAAMPGTAKNQIETIQSKLNSFPLDPAYKLQRQTDIDNLLAQIKMPENEQSSEQDKLHQAKPLDEKTKW